MKSKRLTRRPSYSESGAILPIVIILMLALTITGIAFLSASVLEHSLAMREVYKNQAFFLADAGIDHLTFKLYAGERPTLIGLTPLGDGRYEVVASYGAAGYAISTGQRLKGVEVIAERKIRITIAEESVFDWTIFGDDWVLVGGSTSIGSIDPDPDDRASVGTNSTSEESPYAIDTRGNPTIDAAVMIGPGGDTQTAISAPEAVIPMEDRDVLSSARKMPPLDDFPVWADPEDPTFPDHYISPIELDVTGVQTASVIMGLDEHGNRIAHYSLLSSQAMGDKLIIDKNCILVVGTLDIVGGGIEIAEGIHLTLYITEYAKIKGNGIVNQNDNAAFLHIYGTDDCTEIDFGGTEDFYGAIYAREAAINCSGTAALEGSIIGKSVYIDGNPTVRWDPNLGSEDDPKFVVLTNWKEIFQ